MVSYRPQLLRKSAMSLPSNNFSRYLSPALLLASGAILSSLLALLRDRLLAGAFGASRALDVYYAAFRIPDLLFTLFLLFVASTAFIPVFMEWHIENTTEAKKLLDALFTVFLIFSVAVS